MFGENTGGGNVDPFGLNVESGFGNYAGAVRDNFSQLQDTLTKDSRATDGVTFNEVTGEFESDKLSKEELAAYNKKTNMIRNKFLFRKKQTDQQKKNERDIAKQNQIQQRTQEAATADRARAGNAAVYASADKQGFTDGRGGGFGSRSTGTNENFSNNSGRGRTGYFYGGLASIL